MSSKHGGIYRQPKEEHRGQKENESTAPYKLGKADIKDPLLIAKSQPGYLPT